MAPPGLARHCTKYCLGLKRSRGKAHHLAALPAGPRKSKASGAVPSTRTHGMMEILQYSTSMLQPSFSSEGCKQLLST